MIINKPTVIMKLFSRCKIILIAVCKYSAGKVQILNVVHEQGRVSLIFLISLACHGGLKRKRECVGVIDTFMKITIVKVNAVNLHHENESQCPWH